jgi:hypothetical protein
MSAERGARLRAASDLRTTSYGGFETSAERLGALSQLGYSTTRPTSHHAFIRGRPSRHGRQNMIVVLGFGSSTTRAANRPVQVACLDRRRNRAPRRVEKCGESGLIVQYHVVECAQFERRQPIAAARLAPYPGSAQVCPVFQMIVVKVRVETRVAFAWLKCRASIQRLPTCVVDSVQ